MIIEPQTKELLEQLPQTSHGKALIKFLDQVKEELNDISTLQSWEETIGRKNAIKMIDNLSKFMEPKKVEIKNKNQYI